MPRTATANPRAKRGANAEPVHRKRTIQRLREEEVNTVTASTAALTDPNKPLTSKQRDFVRHWASGETILSASVKAGYTDGGAYAYRLVAMPAVRALYDAEKAKYEADSSMTRKRVIDGLLEAIDMAKMVSEPGSMIAGWREIAKMCGYYAPVEQKITVDHTSNAVMERLNRLSDAELLDLIKQDPAQIIDVEAREVGDDSEADE